MEKRRDVEDYWIRRRAMEQRRRGELLPKDKENGEGKKRRSKGSLRWKRKKRRRRRKTVGKGRVGKKGLRS